MNNKIRLLVCVALLFPVLAQAQFIKGYGIKLGVVGANQDWDYKENSDEQFDTRWGVDAGGFVEFLEMPLLSILAEAHYVQNGVSFEIAFTSPTQPDGPGELHTFKPRLDYLSIPILAKARFGAAATVPYLFAGPRFDFLIDQKPEGFQAVYDHLKKNDIGATIGGGLEIAKVLPFDVMAEFRYSPSFTKAFDNGLLIVKNRSINLLLGIRL